MKGTHALDQRKLRIRQTLDVIKTNHKKKEDTDEKALIAFLAIKIGITKNIAIEYISILEEAGFISRKNGVITYNSEVEELLK